MQQGALKGPSADTGLPDLVDGKYGFADLVELDKLRAIFQQYSNTTGLAVGLVSHHDSKLLLSTGWTRLCADFNRQCPAAEAACKDSNHELTRQLTELKQIAIHPCRNGLIDGATPVIIKGAHLADLYVGQVLFEAPAEEWFRQLALQYEFDVEDYLAALREVRILSEGQLRSALDFMREMAVLLAEVGLARLQTIETTARYSDLTEQTQEPIIVIRDRILVYTNPAFCRLIGCTSPDEVIGLALKDVVHPDQLELISNNYERRLAGDPNVPDIYEVRGLNRQRRELWVEVKAKAIIYDGAPAVQASLHDVTERKLAARKLQEAYKELAASQAELANSERHYRSLIDNAADGITILSATGEIKYAAPSYERLAGYAAEEVQGRSLFDLIHPSEQEELRRQFADLLEKPGISRRSEFRHSHRDGSWRCFEAVGQNLLDDPGINGIVVNFRDVTLRKHAERELVQTQLQLSSILGSLPDVVFYETGGGRELISNNVIELLGYSPQNFMQDRSFFPSIIHPDDQDILKHQIAAWHKTGDKGVLTMEFRCRRADGSYIWLEDRMVRIVPKDAPPYMAGVLLDITERKSAEEAIRNSEQQYRSTIDSFHDPIHVVDPALNVVLQNVALTKWHKELGLNPHIEGRCVKEAYPFIPDEVWQQYDQVFQTGRMLITEEETAVNGRRYITDTRKIPVIEQGQVVRIVTVLRDITERRRVEDAIAQSEQKYRTLVNNMSEGIAVTDQQENFTFGNPAAECIFGVDSGGLVGRNFREFADATSFSTIIAETKKRRAGDIGSYEVTIVRQDGKQRMLRIAASPLLNDKSEYAGSFGLIEDITEQKRLTEQLIRKQKEESMLTLAGGVAHDFNNILMGILGSATLLKDAYAGIGESAELCSTIIKSAQRMVDLTNKLLAYARGGRHQPRPVDIAESVNDSLIMLRGSLPDNISVNSNLITGLWPVEADPGQLHQVLMNLIINAAEAMPDGGTISIDAFNEHREAGWTCPLHYQHPPGRYVHIEVSDFGGGIAPDALTKIFEPFFSTKFQGRGLGLAAAQGIVRSHGGCLHADSRPEQGATFHVFLPATDKPVDKSPADESTAPVCDETILYVDDEEVVRLTACRMLRRQGFEVIVAADGAEGLNAFRESAGKIDLVIFDINMPLLGGADFHEQLRAIDPAIKTIAASGYSESVALDSMDTSELSAFVQKPFTFSDLIRIVRDVLDDKPISRKSAPE